MARGDGPARDRDAGQSRPHAGPPRGRDAAGGRAGSTGRTVPASGRRSRPQRTRAGRYRHIALCTVLALFSVVVLGVTGYGWLAFSDLERGMSTSDATIDAGADRAVDILLVGMDSRTDAQGNPLPDEVLAKLRAGDNGAELTDTMILLRIPEDRSRAVAYSLPRDSYVSIPGHGKHKLNSAFGRGKAEAADRLRSQGVTESAELERRSAEAGRKLMVRTVERLTGVGIDHYAEVNLLGFYRLTKAVGGVEVCLKAPVDDPYSGADFPAGRQVISGADALAFVRQRHGLPDGDLDRVVRQQAFLAGMARSVLSSGMLADPARLREVFDSLKRFVVLDQGWDVLAFARQMQGLAEGNIRFDTIPVEDSTYDTPDGMAVRVDPAEVRAAIRQVVHEPSAAPTTSEQRTKTRPEDTDVSGTTERAGPGTRHEDSRDGRDGAGREAITADEVPCVD
ncbi:LytR family transcriptional attenuator [Halopolyspora algeriensis]|uniref:LytR family transcriptional attenuator n=1 Tax=Halopolyspora algeriensis TaxID=1500506 RepID=A0A368VQA6_9ACTN|nr:LCP family protein [Halopolyspora algeriensis]RCW43668.1 LytR family transcriptional attenuator [Halopolyspora algeriensis]TQM47549.1 LytR family transcriptional attenuator [Halopolyspora algeriensis]